MVRWQSCSTDLEVTMGTCTSYILCLADTPLSFHISPNKKIHISLHPQCFVFFFFLQCSLKLQLYLCLDVGGLPSLYRVECDRGTMKKQRTKEITGSWVLSFVKGCSACVCFGVLVYSHATDVVLWVVQTLFVPCVCIVFRVYANVFISLRPILFSELKPWEIYFWLLFCSSMCVRMLKYFN